jgi:hypothetical protein
MQRRQFIRNTLGIGILSRPLLSRWSSNWNNQSAPSGQSAFSGLSKPVFVYNNWSAYDELSDNVAQTEALVMRELSEIIRLKARGVRIDYYVMDAFWFDQQGGYRAWHKEHWPQGPGAWLRGCHDHAIRPGMWFSTNLVRMGGRQALDVITSPGNASILV